MRPVDTSGSPSPEQIRSNGSPPCQSKIGVDWRRWQFAVCYLEKPEVLDEPVPDVVGEGEVGHGEFAMFNRRGLPRAGFEDGIVFVG